MEHITNDELQLETKRTCQKCSGRKYENLSNSALIIPCMECDSYGDTTELTSSGKEIIAFIKKYFVVQERENAKNG